MYMNTTFFMQHFFSLSSTQALRDIIFSDINLNFFSFVFPLGCCGGPNEKRLLSNLLDKYNTLERPVFNESEPVVVSFGLTLMQIIDVV
jgi:hypothetical protein